MSEYHCQYRYYTEVKWKRMNIKTISSNNELSIQFNLHMPHQDPKFIITQSYPLLTLRRHELPLIGATYQKRMKMYFSGHGKLKFTKNRIMEVLESIMPLAQEERRTTVAKIFKLLTAIPKDANSIHVDIFDHVTEHKPSTRSIMDDDLEKARLDRSCGICMDEFEQGVIAIRLPCLHIFHENCIFPWLERDHKCPLCRNPMPHDDADQLSYEPDVTSPSLSVYHRSYDSIIESKGTPSSMLQIWFSLYESNQSAVVREDGEVSRTSTDAEREFLKTEPQLLTVPSPCDLQPTMITKVLNSLSVPRHEQPAIVSKIYETVASNNADGGGVFIEVVIYEETWDLFDMNGIDRPITDATNEELLGKPKPATKSAIEGLERVRIDDRCRICMHDFEDGLLATRFPCLHIFHGHCALRWLETKHKCPMCQYPLLCD